MKFNFSDLKYSHMQIREIVKIFKSLQDPTRLRIYALIVKAGPICVCELVEVTGIPQATVSRILGILKNADLVVDERCGRTVFYRLSDRLINRKISSLVTEYIKEDETYEKDIRKLRTIHRRRC